MIEISLWIIGYIFWFFFLGLFSYCIIWSVRTNDEDKDGFLVIGISFLIVTLLTGIFVGCVGIWNCSEIMRFV